MAQVKGYICDSCGAMMPEEDRTKRITRFEGATKGFYEDDLCSDCVVVPSDRELRPLRTRSKKAEEPTS